MSIEVILVNSKFGTFEVFVDESDIISGKCCDCGNRIIWGLTKNGKNFPISKVFDENRYEYKNHFEICKGK